MSSPTSMGMNSTSMGMNSTSMGMNSTSMGMNSTSMGSNTTMGMNSSMSMEMYMMTPWLHFGNTDYLIFQPWKPSSSGAIAGACIGLVVFCILERCLAAFRRTQELRWRTRTNVTPNGVRSAKDELEVSSGGSGPVRKRLVQPFNAFRDVQRGVLEAVHATFAYGLMLAVMTFNGAYILSIILGLGIGELLVGRLGREYEVE